MPLLKLITAGDAVGVGPAQDCVRAAPFDPAEALAAAFNHERTNFAAAIIIECFPDSDRAAFADFHNSAIWTDVVRLVDEAGGPSLGLSLQR